VSGLYTQDILRLAADSAAWSRLAEPSASAEKRSPTCGSRIVADIALDTRGRVIAYGHDIRACALGQASATVLARGIEGCSLNELDTAKNDLAAFLLNDQETPGRWPGLDIFAAARGYPARHAAILLPFQAVVEAIQSA
jgi:NifU-like protein involved in Fe-S cluster formation